MIRHLIMLALVLLPAAAHAQQRDSIMAGDRIRLRVYAPTKPAHYVLTGMRNAPRVRGTVVSIGDRLVVAVSEQDTVGIDLAQIVSAAVVRGQTRATWKGARTGLFVGAGIAAIAYLANGGEDMRPLVALPAGAVAGAAIGSTRRTDRWVWIGGFPRR